MKRKVMQVRMHLRTKDGGKLVNMYNLNGIELK